ncbi:hypothetical protein [Streptomyces sp. NBC_01006]|uniref:hypothetical protein n=1 Tax=Streptomyces sp. NBC_01006 TaxID=2903716 RepID=UPI00386DD5D0
MACSSAGVGERLTAAMRGEQVEDPRAGGGEALRYHGRDGDRGGASYRGVLLAELTYGGGVDFEARTGWVAVAPRCQT